MNTKYLYKSTLDSPFVEFEKQLYLKKDKLKFDTIHNGLIIPFEKNNSYGVFSENRENVGTPTEYTDSIPYIEDFENFDFVDEQVVFLGNFRTSQWGNIFVDFLSRLYFILNNQHDYRIAYCGTLNLSQNANGVSNINTLEILKLIGITEERLIKIEKSTKFKTLIVPEKSFVPFQYFTNEYSSIYEFITKRIITNSTLKTEKNIYFTRRQMERRKEVGEQLFELFFRLNGFKILAPEKLSVSEQIYYVNNCEILASLEGSAAHNVLWANPKMQQIILRKQSEVMPRQFQLNEAKNIPVTYIDVYKEPFIGFPITHDRGPFLLMFNENIRQFAKDTNMHLPNTIGWLNTYNVLIYSAKCLQMAILHFVGNKLPIIKNIYKKIIK